MLDDDTEEGIVVESGGQCWLKTASEDVGAGSGCEGREGRRWESEAGQKVGVDPVSHKLLRDRQSTAI